MPIMRASVLAFVLVICGILPLGADQGRPLPNFIGPGDGPSVTGLDGQAGLKFLTTLDFPPFSFLDADGRLTGYNVYLAKLICVELQLSDKCTIQASQWSEATSLLDGGQVNAIVAGVAANESSRENFLFSRSYMRMPARFVATQSSSTKFDFQGGLEGLRIGVLAHSGFEALAHSYFPSALITGYASEALLQSDLRAGKTDLAFDDGMRLAFWLSSGDGVSCCRFVGEPYYSDKFLGEGLRIAVAAGSVDLQKQIDHALISLQRKGSLDELYLRFFPKGFY